MKPQTPKNEMIGTLIVLIIAIVLFFAIVRVYRKVIENDPVWIETTSYAQKL